MGFDCVQALEMSFLVKRKMEWGEEGKERMAITQR